MERFFSLQVSPLLYSASLFIDFWFQTKILLASNWLYFISLFTDILSSVCHSITSTFILQCITPVCLLYAMDNTQGFKGICIFYCCRRGRKERENMFYDLLSLSKMVDFTFKDISSGELSPTQCKSSSEIAHLNFIIHPLTWPKINWPTVIQKSRSFYNYSVSLKFLFPNKPVISWSLDPPVCSGSHEM